MNTSLLASPAIEQDVITDSRDVLLPVVEHLTRTVCCSQCGRDFPFGSAEQAATEGKHGFSHCGDHVAAAKQNRGLCTTTLTNEQVASFGLKVPANQSVKLDDGCVVVAVPTRTYEALSKITKRQAVGAAPLAMNAAQQDYGRGKFSGD